MPRTAEGAAARTSRLKQRGLEAGRGWQGNASRRIKGYLPIADYAIIGDCRSTALVGVDGSIDWCCLPRFDSPSVFGRLLDDRRGGSWQIAPAGEYTSRQAYADKTNILRTIFQTDEGMAVVTDFMPVHASDVKQHAKPHPHPRIVRLVTGLAGKVKFRQRIELRPDFGATAVVLESSGGRVHGEGGDYHFCFSGSAPLSRAAQEFTVHPGDTVSMGLTVNRGGECGVDLTDIEVGRRLLRTTQEFWWRWGEQCTYRGPYSEEVLRSALALKLLTYAPTGAIVAAPTTSLPEWIGGPRNWDYRYTWIRDASFTLYSLFQLGFTQEATDFFHWIGHLTLDKELRILYTLSGTSPGAEEELSHLEGYRGSRPVRVGNGAAGQLQLDVYGELIDCAYLYMNYGGPIHRDLWAELRKIVDFACDQWELRDAGLWEVRGANLDFTYSKAMCWAAVDRGLRIAERLGLPAPTERWRAARRRIHAAVVRHGYSRRIQSFTQSFGSDQLDASALRLIQMGFLRLSDPRLRTTIDAIDNSLSLGPLVYRYHVENTDDGFETPEGSFIICAFWLADALALVGELEEAQRRFERLLQFASPLGLFAEEVHPSSGALLGNFPQAFSHLAMISAAVNIERRRENRLSRSAHH